MTDKTITPPAPDCTPSLAPRYLLRWEESQNAWVLLYPEGIIKLNPSASEILRRCDGQRTPVQVIAELAEAFPDAGPALADNVNQFVGLALGKGWLRA